MLTLEKFEEATERLSQVLLETKLVSAPASKFL